MQMRLPIFPSSSRLINANTAVYADADMVYYMHSGSVIYCHEKSDLQGYRYITANLVVSGLCKPKVPKRNKNDLLSGRNINGQHIATPL